MNEHVKDALEKSLKGTNDQIDWLTEDIQRARETLEVSVRALRELDDRARALRAALGLED